MIVEIGVVKKTEGIHAMVIVQKKSSCESCNSGGACSQSPEGVEMLALNTAKAVAGQTVKVTMRAHTYVKGTMLLYGIPMILFIAAAIIGQGMGEKYFPSFNPEIISAVSAFTVLFLSFVVIKLLMRNSEKKTEYQPVIEEIVKDADGNSCPTM
ncbi:MAG: SoxR reducing system RseC family protein [Nitrospira sp.]|nr:SoxR reducing system RseC family protein [bacterium]MBL7049885.1 SoxR reducing system RseC family protein [Nitrospira sp.]